MTAIVRLALEEDIGAGDVTTRACVPEDRQARGRFLAREALIVAGLGLLDEIYERPVEKCKRDGDACVAGEVLAQVAGPARLLLERERVALNFLQRLSGVATLARHFAEAVAGTSCRVLDTRKTTPGMRALEKAAAAAGGVTNHRMGLYDAVLIKNNHIAAAGSVRAAIERARAQPLPDGAPLGPGSVEPAQPLPYGAPLGPGSVETAQPLPHGAPLGPGSVEVEVRTRAELEEALAAGATHLLLDNLTPAEAAEWVRHIAGRATIELSGGITLANVRAYAEAGADFVSSGAITHSARAMDISFRLELA